MQKQDIQTGKNYLASIDSKIIVVKIDGEHKPGGWLATNLENQKQLRINNVRKIRREATDAEAQKSSPPPDDGKKLSAQFAYENWRRNNNINGLIIFETADKHLMFGDNAQIAAVALKREKKIFKSSFTFEKKSFLEKVLQFEEPEVLGVMAHLGRSGNHVFLAVQKIEDGKKVQLFEIVKHVLAGHTDIQPGLPPFSTIKATAEIVRKRKSAATRAEVKADTRYVKKHSIQHIDIKPGETFKSQSGNEYQIQMVSETAVYAQQLRDGKPTGPTRPFDKKSVADGYPKGLHGEDSYYPKSEALDAAEKVLNNATEPMDAKSIIVEIRNKKLWFTTARTPHTTLAAAISRDIKRNGNSSRFQRIGRGMYQLTNKPAAKQPVKTAEAKTIKAKVKKTPKPKMIEKAVKKTTPKATQKTPKTKK